MLLLIARPSSVVLTAVVSSCSCAIAQGSSKRWPVPDRAQRACAACKLSRRRVRNGISCTMCSHAGQRALPPVCLVHLQLSFACPMLLAPCQGPV